MIEQEVSLVEIISTISGDSIVLEKLEEPSELDTFEIDIDLDSVYGLDIGLDPNHPQDALLWSLQPILALLLGSSDPRRTRIPTALISKYWDSLYQTSLCDNLVSHFLSKTLYHKHLKALVVPKHEAWATIIKVALRWMCSYDPTKNASNPQGLDKISFQDSDPLDSEPQGGIAPEFLSYLLDQAILVDEDLPDFKIDLDPLEEEIEHNLDLDDPEEEFLAALQPILFMILQSKDPIYTHVPNTLLRKILKDRHEFFCSKSYEDWIMIFLSKKEYHDYLLEVSKFNKLDDLFPAFKIALVWLSNYDPETKTSTGLKASYKKFPEPWFKEVPS